MKKIGSFFEVERRGSTIGRELSAGGTTFLTMSYIIFVQPAVLSMTGMDFGAVMVATCLSSAAASALMAFLANYPIGLAPAMGHNFFFALTVCGAAGAGGMGFTWQEALAAVFISGSLFLFLSFFGFREKVINAVPQPLRIGLAVGIGLLIALLGLQWGGIIVDNPGTLVGLGDIKSGPALLTLFGVFLIVSLSIRGVRSAILIGILTLAVTAAMAGMAEFSGIVSAPPPLWPTLFKLDILGLFQSPDFWLVITTFFILDLFDTVGTLVGLGASANLLDKDGKLPKAERALAADAGGTVLGALLGTSTVTSYIESAAGIAAGGRTGLAALTTAVLFVLAIFFSPLAKMASGGYEVSEGVYLYPVIAPALIVVGSMMLKLVRDISWEDTADGFSAYLTIIVTPLTVSITEGISAGFVSYSLLKTVEGRFREVHPLTHLLALLFVLRYAFLV
ncbi:MAG: NCS2 family permease [Candidatus Nitrospinota bacterium M3_3B_026]